MTCKNIRHARSVIAHTCTSFSHLNHSCVRNVCVMMHNGRTVMKIKTEMKTCFLQRCNRQSETKNNNVSLVEVRNRTNPYDQIYKYSLTVFIAFERRQFLVLGESRIKPMSCLCAVTVTYKIKIKLIHIINTCVIQ